MIPSPPFPTEAQHFKGRYKVWLGVALLIIGTVNILLNLRSMGLEGQVRRPIVVGLVMGILVALLGILYLTRPYFRVAPNRLTVYNLFGKAAKRYPFASFGHIKLEDKSIYIESSYIEEANHREQVKINKWMVRSDDWERLQALTTSDKPQT
ncbi:MAG: hypothetical protein WBB01_09335 [Phormidesmis sp.]